MGLLHVSRETSSFCRGTEFLGSKPSSHLLGRLPCARVSQPWHWTSWDGLQGVLGIPGLHPQKARTASHRCDNHRCFPHSQCAPQAKLPQSGTRPPSLGLLRAPWEVITEKIPPPHPHPHSGLPAGGWDGLRRQDPRPDPLELERVYVPPQLLILNNSSLETSAYELLS